MKALISRNTEIKVRLGGEALPFTSRITRIRPGSKSKASGVRGRLRPLLVMERLNPERGNLLIESSQKVIVDAIVGTRALQFDSLYAGMSNVYPYIGILVFFPDLLRIGEIRREERVPVRVSEFISVQFFIGKGPISDKLFRLNVLNYSGHGLGILIPEPAFDLLRYLKRGDKIRDMFLFSKWAMLKVDVTVRHISKIQEGDHKGEYVIGVESEEMIGLSKKGGGG